jgi:hypothetical protein
MMRCSEHYVVMCVHKFYRGALTLKQTDKLTLSEVDF